MEEVYFLIECEDENDLPFEVPLWTKQTKNLEEAKEEFKKIFNRNAEIIYKFPDKILVQITKKEALLE